MAQTKKRERGERDYLFRRSERGPWWIKLQPPKRITNTGDAHAPKLIEKSLGTTDRALADEIARPMIDKHKHMLFAARAPHGVTAWRHEYEPDREHVGPDGGKIIATDRE